jgi:16S rRNA (cytosine967-C5)-methyltransferase
MKPLSARKIAWKALIEFERSRSNPEEILGKLFGSEMTERDRALAWELTKGTIMLQKKFDNIAQAYVKAPLRTQKVQVLAALRMGFFQLTEMSGIPQFAAVDETVGLLATEGMKRDAGFINAVLRSYLREPERAKLPEPEAEPIKYLSTYYSYPDWLVRRWHSRFGYDETKQMLIANNARMGMSFRLIDMTTDRDEALEELRTEGISVETGRYFPEFIKVEDGAAVIKSRLFQEGKLSVQDESQGLPLYLLNPGTGDEVLDLCAAPGGKTVGLSVMVGPQGKVIALDIVYKRLKQIQRNAERLKLDNIEYQTGDLLKFAPGRKFRYILLDVPCSGLGTLSQNVDLRWLKKEKDILTLAQIQSSMISKAAEWLDDNGYLVYSTCTTELEEIEDVVLGFVNSRKEFTLVNSESELAAPFNTQIGIYRTWPHKHGIGGGGFALLRKINEV